MAILLIANILDLMFNHIIFEKKLTNFIVYKYNLKKILQNHLIKVLKENIIKIT